MRSFMCGNTYINCTVSLKNLSIGDNCKKCLLKIDSYNEDFRFIITAEVGDDVMSLICFKKNLLFEIKGKNFISLAQTLVR